MKTPPVASVHHSRMSSSFPHKLYELLSREDAGVIGWNQNGKSFTIHDAPRFCNEVLPRYFRHCKLTSFQRQLNLYDFQRVHVGPLGGAYYHPLFHKDKPMNCDQIKRASKKGSADDDASKYEMPLPIHDRNTAQGTAGATDGVGFDSLPQHMRFPVSSRYLFE